ncbi:MAG: FAD-dependent oxidoreductase [Candidatus Neomarinimicrobiota bacterium]
MDKSFVSIPEARLETRFKDAKPLYSETEALTEANRCLFCYDAPCITACPTSIDIPGFIRKITTGNIRGAAQTIFRSNLLGVSTSRVCPVEELCAGACVLTERPINIGRLQRYATETALEWEENNNQKLFNAKPSNDHKVALIGAGPASLSCAAYLALNGIQPVIFEKDTIPGGLNITGIAPYKTQSTDIKNEIDWLCQFGIEIRTGVQVGRDIMTDQLLADFDAIFLGLGLGKDKRLAIPGEDSEGVWGATHLIRMIKIEKQFTLPEDLKSVIVIGGGNTAIDIARELAMLGVPNVDILYRRTILEMPGYKHEFENARRYGVRMIEYEIPDNITNDGKLILHTKHKITGEQSRFESDWIVVAIGQDRHVNELIPGLKVDGKDQVVVDPGTQLTSVPNVYAGGDCINGGKEVVNAVADGRNAAHSILQSLGLEIN